MFRLVPEWAKYDDEFWISVRKRNLWFIQLRYGIAVVLSLFAILIDFEGGLKFGSSQTLALLIITASILLYNGLFHYLRRFVKFDEHKFNPLHLSIMQIVSDCIALAMMVYFTGGVESPLCFLFVFHMIIGSLILPGAFVYLIAALIVIFFSLFSFLEYSGIIAHQSISGLYNWGAFNSYSVYNNPHFLIVFNLVFGFVIVFCVVLTNKIARQLYRTEQRLWESIDNLSKSDAEKQIYIMAVVHEIKNPLTAVHSYLSIILSKILGPIPQKAEERLQRALNRTDEAVGLINSVLMISRMRLMDQISQETVDVAFLIKKLIGLYTPTLEAKQQSVSIIGGYEGECNVLGDPGLLEMVFSNLLSNAIKYGRREGVIQIRFVKEKKAIVITIADDGIGIPEKDLPNLFQEFFRASNTHGKGYEGTGLGLSTVKQIVEKHNGTISIESPSELAAPEYPGTAVTVRIPLLQ